MKITIIFLILCVFQVFTIKLYSQEPKITINLGETTVEEILKEIENQSEYYFLFNQKLVDITRKVNIQVTDKQIDEILAEVFNGTNVDYVIIDRQIVLSMSEYLADVKTKLHSRSIKGKVSDESGVPLPGVSILLKSTSRGTITNLDGEYTIEIEDLPSAVLIFSFVGYLTREIPVGNQTILNVNMAPDLIGLEEVIVIGYGSLRKSDLSGSVSSVDIEDMSLIPVISADQMLQGQVSGVHVTTQNGAPGSGLIVTIRGGNSINASNQPLYVIDGFPIDPSEGFFPGIEYQAHIEEKNLNPLATFNPNEVESIEILKDASSTAIYGSRGANGVVMITTKTGKTKSSIINPGKVEYKFRTDISNLPKQIEMLSSREFMEYRNEAYIFDGKLPPYTQAEVDSFSVVNTNWQDLIYQTGHSQDHQLIFTNADDLTNIALVGGYTSQHGIIKNSKLERYSIRANILRKFKNKFETGVNFSASRTSSRMVLQSSTSGRTGSSVIAGALYFPPINLPYDEYGNIFKDPDILDSPLIVVEEVKDDYTIQNMFAVLFGEYTILPGVNLKAELGTHNTNTLRQMYYPSGTYVGQNGGSAYRADGWNYSLLSNNTLNINKTIHSFHKINAVVGYTHQWWISNYISNRASNFINDNLTYYYFQGAENSEKPRTHTTKSGLASFIGRINYTLMDKYIFTITGRADGSTRLGEGNKWAYFPSGAFAWRISEEPFFDPIKQISNLKIRTSYGQTGNQSIPPYRTKSTLVAKPSISGGQQVTGFVAGNFGNPDLKWEVTSQIDVGLDIGLLNNRLSVSFDYFKKNTRDLLISLPIPLSTGFSSYWTNIGEIENKGFDLEFNANILSRKLDWVISGSWSTYKNKVLDLGTAETVYGNNWYSSAALFSQPLHIAMVGEAVGSYYGYKFDGIFQNEDEVNNSSQPYARPGDYRFVDLNGDGAITADDRTILGNNIPDFIFGLRNNLSWRGFNLYIFIQGSIGNEIINFNRYAIDGLAAGIEYINVSRKAYENRWTGEGTSDTYGRLRSDNLLFDRKLNDILVEDGSYIRLKNVSLSYNIQLKKLNWLKTLDVFINGANLLTLTDYTGYDPEVSAKETPLEPGVDLGVFPQPRIWSFGINIGF